MAKAKKTQKAVVKEAIDKVVKKSKKAVKKAALSQYGHRIGTQSGYIDQHLDKTPKEIANGWNAAHPDKKMKDGRVKGHLQHLIEKHGFSKTTMQQMLATNKVANKAASKNNKS